MATHVRRVNDISRQFYKMWGPLITWPLPFLHRALSSPDLLPFPPNAQTEQDICTTFQQCQDYQYISLFEHNFYIHYHKVYMRIKYFLLFL